MWKNLKNIYLIIFLLNLYFAGSGSDSLEMDKIHSRTLPSRSLEFSRKTLYLELWAEVFGILTFIVWQTFFYILGIIFLIFSLNKIGSSQPVIISALYWMWKTSARNPIYSPLNCWLKWLLSSFNIEHKCHLLYSLLLSTIFFTQQTFILWK